MAEREGLTQAVPALALRARSARPKSLLRFCRTPPGSNPRFVSCRKNPSCQQTPSNSMAETERFLTPSALSRGAPSTTRPPLPSGKALSWKRGMIPARSSPGKAIGGQRRLSGVVGYFVGAGRLMRRGVTFFFSFDTVVDLFAVDGHVL